MIKWIKENWHDAKNYKLHKLDNINIKDIRKKLAKEFINDIKYDLIISDIFKYQIERYIKE